MDAPGAGWGRSWRRWTSTSPGVRGSAVRQKGVGRGGEKKRGGVKKRLLAGVKKRLLAGVSSCAGWRLAGEGAPEQDGLGFAAADEGEAYGDGGEWPAGCGLLLPPADGDNGDDDGWDDDQSDTSSVSSFGSVIAGGGMFHGICRSAAVASPCATVLTEIYLCSVCSCQEILRRPCGSPMASRAPPV
jgi:hypothetical protein